MNISRISCLGLFCVGFLSLTVAFGQQSTPGFDAANRLYDQGKFRDAAAAYQQMIQQGHATAPLYFNLGNALFKSGQVGRAIAVYRTLETITPRDPDLRANLRFALAQVRGPSLQDSVLVRWVRGLSLSEWAIAVSLGFWILMLLLGFAQLRPQFKRVVRRYAVTTGLLTLFTAACLALSIHQAYYVSRAVVIVPEASVRRGPLEESESPFTVYNGAQLQVLDRNGEWAQVTAGAGKSGWIRLDQIQTGRGKRS